MDERDRIDFVLRRDGLEACIAWVRRGMRIYRQAVLDPHHFASGEPYRRRFIAAYCEFKRWLGERRRSAGAPGSPPPAGRPPPP